MLRRAGTGTSGQLMSFVQISALLIVIGLGIICNSLWHVRTDLITAASNGARVAAITGDTAEVQLVVSQSLQNAGLPTTYKGTTLFSISATNVTNGPLNPIATVTVHYQAPILFPNLFAALGKPHSLPPSIDMSESQSYVNETYYGGVTSP